MGCFLVVIIGLAVSSKVDTVFVYPNQVVVVRSATVDISGAEELIFSGLPGGIDDNTVRVRATGLRIGEVQVKKGYLAEPTPVVKRLEEKVRLLEDSLKTIEDEMLVLKAKEEFLNSVKLGAPEIIAKELQQGKVAPESWRGALHFIADELGRVKMQALTLSRRQEETKKRLEAARKELQEARALIENRKEIRVEVDGEPGTYRLALSYALPRAADWRPYYELRAKPGSEAVELTYFAKVSQRTGEDWENVKLILSTATPSREVRPPEPRPWFLKLIEEVFQRKMMPAPGGVMAERAIPEEVEAEAPMDVMAVETGVSLQYVLPGKATLKSGEPEKKLELKVATLPAQFEHYTLPRSLEKTFLTGKLMNTTDFILLPGDANTYVGDEFTGGTQLPAVAPQESLGLGFGVDERVKVKRELVKTFKSGSGVLSKTERVQFVYRTTVENYHPKQIKIKILEQVPVSQEKEIKVTVTKIEPKFSERDQEKGIFTYYVELKPKERFEINLEFFVEYPAGKKVGGLY
ncbi:MAG: DUF4139 domain-containing protein [candidate division WOR-3 bacterium]